MSAESTLYGILSAAAGVTALVGTRIYPDFIPEEIEAPYLAYTTTSDPINTIHGTKFGDDVNIEIVCWADTRLSAEAVADAVVTAMQAAGHLYTARGKGLDEDTGRLAARLDYTILIQ